MTKLDKPFFFFHKLIAALTTSSHQSSRLSCIELKICQAMLSFVPHTTISYIFKRNRTTQDKTKLMKQTFNIQTNSGKSKASSRRISKLIVKNISKWHTSKTKGLMILYKDQIIYNWCTSKMKKDGCSIQRSRPKQSPIGYKSQNNKITK